MAEKKKNKNLKLFLIIARLFFAGLFIGRTVGIIMTYDDIINFGDFLNRLNIGDFSYLIMFTLLTVGSILINREDCRV